MNEIPRPRLHICGKCGKCVCDIRDSGKIVVECPGFSPIEYGPKMSLNPAECIYIGVQTVVTANPGEPTHPGG